MSAFYNGLENSLGFMAGITSRRLTLLFQTRLKAYGITPEQWAVLYQTGQSDGLIQREIGRMAGKDKPTTTRILDHLLAKGLVDKRPDPHDGRSTLVSVTEKGRDMLVSTTPIEEQTREEVRAALNEEEYDTLLRLLGRVNLHLDQFNNQHEHS